MLVKRPALLVINHRKSKIKRHPVNVISVEMLWRLRSQWDSSSKLSLLKKIAEIQEPLEVEYRCVQCRNCSQCRDADKTEKISIREESEMYAIRQSIFLNYDKKRIDCSLPLRGQEREFMSTNTDQVVAILKKQ